MTKKLAVINKNSNIVKSNSNSNARNSTKRILTNSKRTPGFNSAKSSLPDKTPKIKRVVNKINNGCLKVDESVIHNYHLKSADKDRKLTHISKKPIGMPVA